MKQLGYIIASFVILLNVQFVNAQGDVKIGTQVWTSKNLDVSTFRNGEVIPEAKSKVQWKKAGENEQPAWCYYDFDSKNGKVYGKLYNWYAVNDSRGLAPKGYHIPSDEEWTVLTDFLGRYGTGFKMMSTTGWSYSGHATNTSGFNGLPGGYCNGYFFFVAVEGLWWSSSKSGSYRAHSRNMRKDNSGVGKVGMLKNHGLSVRCIKN